MRDKFASRAIKCVFIGYAELKKVYKLYDLEIGSIFCSCDIQFCENLFLFKLGNTLTENISNSAKQFIKSFSFYDDLEHIVNDENLVTNDGNDLAAPLKIATDCQSLDAPIEEAIDRSNTSAEPVVDSSLPSNKSVSMPSRQHISETNPFQ